MEGDQREEGIEGGHDGSVEITRVLGMLLPRLVFNVLTNPINCLLAVCMVWGREEERERGREEWGKEGGKEKREEVDRCNLTTTSPSK